MPAATKRSASSDRQIQCGEARADRGPKTATDRASGPSLVATSGSLLVDRNLAGLGRLRGRRLLGGLGLLGRGLVSRLGLIVLLLLGRLLLGLGLVVRA